MADLNTTRDNLNRIGIVTVQDIKGDLRSKDKVASQGLIGSVRFDINDLGSFISLNFWANDYWEFVDKGRGPGKQPPPQAIEDWVKTKGIATGKEMKTVAYLIGRSIGQKGVKGTDIFTDNIEKAKEQFRLSSNYIEQITNLTRQALTNGSSNQ